MEVDGPVDDQYLLWLIHCVGAEEYTKVCNTMQKIVFDASVPNDDNRAAEGKDLRRQFLEQHNYHTSVYYMWLAPPASIFETLAALTDHAEFMTGISKDKWFKIFLGNLHIENCHDGRWSGAVSRKVQRALEMFNHRHYMPSGHGGLFPIQNSIYDQREIEIWYQMCAFIQENQMY